jgi:hypothetical protein
MHGARSGYSKVSKKELLEIDIGQTWYFFLSFDKRFF